MIGWSDLPADLSDTATLARLSGYLPQDALVVSSDLLRATETADAIQHGRHRLPHLRDLREIHFGAWERRRHSEIEAEDPNHIRAYWEHPGSIRPPGGESWNDVCARVNAAIDHLTKCHPGQNLIVVAHFGVILTQIQRALALNPKDAFGHRIDNLSVTELGRLPNGWDVGTINHLP